MRKYPSKPNKTHEKQTQVTFDRKLRIITDYRCALTGDCGRLSPTTLNRQLKVNVFESLSRGTVRSTAPTICCATGYSGNTRELSLRQTYTSIVGSIQLGVRHLLYFPMFSSSLPPPPRSRWVFRSLSSYIALLPSDTQQNQFNVMLEACCRKCRSYLLHTHTVTLTHTQSGACGAVAPC